MFLVASVRSPVVSALMLWGPLVFVIGIVLWRNRNRLRVTVPWVIVGAVGLIGWWYFLQGHPRLITHQPFIINEHLHLALASALLAWAVILLGLIVYYRVKRVTSTPRYLMRLFWAFIVLQFVNLFLIRS